MAALTTRPVLRKIISPVFAVALVSLIGLPQCALGQQGYGSYYGQTVVKSHGQLGTQSSSRYLYDEYFNKRPSVSPYINLDRFDTMDGTAYQSYVRPEQQRRDNAMAAQRTYIDARKREGRVGDTRYPGATYGGGGTAIMKPHAKPVSTPGAYHNHWYGGWQNR
jgi:hypothetical protein